MLAALLLLQLDPSPARTGESGILDAPDATALPVLQGRFGGELRVDPSRSTVGAVVPSPLWLGLGLGGGFELGMSMQASAAKAPMASSPLELSAALKLVLAEEPGWGLAVDAVGDRLNLAPRPALRLIGSSSAVPKLRWSAYVGAGATEAANVGPLVGVATAWEVLSRVELLGEATGSADLWRIAGGVLWRVSRGFGLGLLVDGPLGGPATVSLGASFLADSPGFSRPEEAPPPAAPRRRFTTEVPRFRLMIRAARTPAEGGLQQLAHPLPKTPALGATAKAEFGKPKSEPGLRPPVKPEPEARPTAALLRLVLRDELGSGFEVERARVVLDGVVVLEQGDVAASQTVAYEGPIEAKPHWVEVMVTCRPTGFGVFTYVSGYSVKLEARYGFTTHVGEATSFTVIPGLEGDWLTPTLGRPTLRYEAEVKFTQAGP
ncbi:MAG: hypothetical protein HY791_13395 [Deltaproteobacteria bacterium]|nr:hypothetical protein [Deltaproteobacteria bacterium]